jgi:hypothetical protein
MDSIVIEPPGADEETDPLCYYLRHRLGHPVPKAWTHQFAILEEPPPDLDIQWPAQAFVRFQIPRWNGELRVTALLFEAGALGVDMLDQGGDGLSPWEVSELLFTLLGVEVDPLDLEQKLASYESEAPHESGDTEDADGDGWKLKILFRYPPTREEHPDEKESAGSPITENINPN